MEAVVDRENLKNALARVKGNKSAAGVDGMSVNDLPAYLKEHWPPIRNQLLESNYNPQPVRRVEIPKASGGMRPLGIPTVLDHPAGGNAGAASGLGPDVLRDELRLSTGALGASGGTIGADVYRVWTYFRGRL